MQLKITRVGLAKLGEATVLAITGELRVNATDEEPLVTQQFQFGPDAEMEGIRQVFIDWANSYKGMNDLMVQLKSYEGETFTI